MPGLLTRRLRLLAVVIVAALPPLGLATAGWAEAPILSAPEASDRIRAGDFILLDIRAPQEWAESGVAEGAWPLSMHVEGFPEGLQAILQRYRPDQIGLICATGSRSAYIADILEQNGIVGVVDISEGMFGNPSGAGWIARGLPVVSAEAAKLSYDKAQEAWGD